MTLTDSKNIGHLVDKKRATHINEFEFADIFFSLLWVCRRPGREPMISPLGVAAGF